MTVTKDRILLRFEMKTKTKTARRMRNFCFYVAVLVLLLPAKTFAGWKLEVPIPPMKGGTEVKLDDYVTNVYNFMFMAVGIIGVLMFLVGGFQYMISAGNKAVSSEAKKTMINAIIGIILVLAAFIILSTINRQLVNFENLNFQ